MCFPRRQRAIIQQQTRPHSGLLPHGVTEPHVLLLVLLQSPRVAERFRRVCQWDSTLRKQAEVCLSLGYEQAALCPVDHLPPLANCLLEDEDKNSNNSNNNNDKTKKPTRQA